MIDLRILVYDRQIDGSEIEQVRKNIDNKLVDGV